MWIRIGHLRRRIAVRLQDWAEELAGIWRYAKARDDLDRLTNAALRDLGIDRSEIGSFLAEAEGRAARTRIRLAGRLLTRDCL